MADYTDQDINGLLPGEPWTSAKAIAAFENPIAIAQGAPGAPRLFARSIEQLEPGSDVRIRQDDQQFFSVSAGGNTLNSARVQFTSSQWGVVRAQIEKVSGTGEVVIQRDQTVIAQSTANDVLTADVLVSPNETVSVRYIVNGGGNITIKNARFLTNGQDIWPGVSINGSLENRAP